MTADAEIDELYGVAPEEFVARRKELVAAAKTRGDVDVARVIGAARRPTAAAWVVNLLVRRDPTARSRLDELRGRLRAAHGSMDGVKIRELSRVQRTLIDGLVRAGLTAADYADPPAALRNDVTDTLQAAIADPDVAARLGRLEKAERWSGFGEFGEAPAVAPEPDSQHADVTAATERVAAAVAAAEAAERDHDVAIDTLSKGTTALATARRRYEKLLATLDAAEREVNSATAECEDAERMVHDTADRLGDATAEHERAVSELAGRTH